jgi:EmrB/QacA subfamily drug resistance transporter
MHVPRPVFRQYCSTAGEGAELMAWANQTAGDICTAHVARKIPCARPSLVLIACILASSLAFVDGSVVNVGLPAIGHDLQGDAAGLQWVINAYLLPLSALLLLGGAIGDRFGRRAVLVTGISVFAVGSGLCAIAPALSWLLAARTLQGIGAAFLLPNSLGLLGSVYSGAARGRAIGIWSAASAITAAIGPVVGGWLIDTAGWRTVFLINLPLAAAAIVLALASVREPGTRENKQALDLLGAVVATASLISLTWSLTIGGSATGWTTPVLLVGALGLLLAGAFLRIEKQRGVHAMMPLALFASRDFVGLTGLTFLVYGALGALLVLVPFVLIRGGGYAGTWAGAALLPFPIVLAVASPRMGTLAGKIGSRVPLGLGPLVVGGGFLLLLRLDAPPRFWNELLPAMFLIAVGMAGVAAPLTTAVLASVDPRHTAVASGLNSAVARTGGMIATALLGSVFAAQGVVLFRAFHVAVIVCAVASFCAGGLALATLGKDRQPPGDDD